MSKPTAQGIESICIAPTPLYSTPFGFGIITFLLLFLILCLTKGYSQNSDAFRFNHITVEDGLTQNTVNQVLQDYDGFMWFSTEDGLNRWDGSEMLNYRQIPLDNKNNFASRITDMSLFSDSVLWLKMRANSCSWTAYNKKFGFKPAQDFFKQVDFEDRQLCGLFLDSKNRYWLSLTSLSPDPRNELVQVTKDSVLILDILSEVHLGFQRFVEFKDGSIIAQDASLKWYCLPDGQIDTQIKHLKDFELVNSLVLDDSNGLFLCKQNLLIRYDWLKKSADTVYVAPPNIKLSFPFIDDENWIWVNYGDKGIAYFDGIESHIRLVEDNVYKSHRLFNAGIIDELGNIWIGTMGSGIIHYDKSREVFTQIKPRDSSPYSLSHPFITDICKDRDGNLWFSTLERGLSQFDPKNYRFQVFQSNALEPNSLSANIIRDIKKRPDETYWFATRSGGIAVLNELSNSFFSVLNDHATHFEALHFDGDTVLWIGTRDKGIFKLNLLTQELEPLSLSEQTPKCAEAQKYVRRIVEDADKNLWFCTWGGLIFLDAERKNCHEVIIGSASELGKSTNNVVFSICQAMNGSFYVGTENGILNINQSGKILKQYQNHKEQINSLSNNTVFNIVRDSKGRFWAGTFGGGLNLFMPESDDFKCYSLSDGLPNACIYGILEDGSGNLWLSTNNGLSCFNPEAENFINYFKAQGLPSSAFNFGAFFKENHQSFWFGTEEGLIHFNPDELLKGQERLQEVIISDFSTNDSLKDFQYFLSQKPIIITAKDHVVRFKFVCPSYSSSYRPEYAYRIEKIHDSWISTGTNNSAIFTDLPAGRYNFEVKVIEKNGSSNPITKVPLIVHPPLYKTLGFKLLCAFIMIFLLGIFYFFRIRHIKRLEKIRLNIAGDLHDEIGSSLGSISFIGYQLGAKRLEKNEQKIMGNQLTELSRETGESMRDIVWFVNPQNDDIKKLIIRMRDFATQLFPTASVVFEATDNLAEPIKLKIKRNMYLIFKEALHNSLKHSKATEVSIKLWCLKGWLILTVADNGQGFAPKLDGDGMGLDNMQKRAIEVNGTLRIHSQKNEGTVIEFKVKLWKRSFRLFR